MKNPDRQKIEMILKSSPERTGAEHRKRTPKFPKEHHENNHVYVRSCSLPQNDHRNAMVSHFVPLEKQCLVRPSS